VIGKLTGFFNLKYFILCLSQTNGLRYLRWGGDGEAVRANKANGLIIFETLTLPQRQVDALLARMI
jgi:hypothetical protein